MICATLETALNIEGGGFMFEPIPFDEFRARSGISKSDFLRGWDSVEVITSLREMVIVQSVQVMPFEYLKQLLTRVPLNGEGNHQVYCGCEIHTARVDPSSLIIGQTFVERAKYQSFLEKFQDAFAGFCVTRGVAKCTALIAFGLTHEGRPAIAHYLPPIVEIHNEWCLLDGIHRNFLVKTVGTTLESIFVRNVTAPFPCGLQEWGKISIVSEKPPRDKRFVNLQPQLFRNLKYIGIDS